MMLIVPVLFLLSQLGVYALFKRWVSRVESQLDETLAELSSKPRSGKNVAEDARVLVYGASRKKAVWGLALIVLGVPLVVAVLISLAENVEDTWSNVVGSSLFLCGIGLGPWILFLEPYGSYRIVTKSGIFTRSPWNGRFYVSWDEVVSVKWIPVLDNFFLRTEKGIIAVTPVFENLAYFAQAVLANVPSSKRIQAQKKLDRALSGSFQP